MKLCLEIINTISQVVMAVTGVIAGVLAYKEYLKSPAQEEEPTTYDEIDKESENEIKLLKQEVFVTSKQKTTLKVTDKGLECHLKDIRPDKGGLQWTISPSQAKFILEKSDYYVNPGFRSRTGRFNIGKRRNWLYSKKLFPEPDYLKSVIKELLINTNQL